MHGRIGILSAGAAVTIYLVVVVICLVEEFGVGDGPFGPYYFPLLVLTLPWSVVPWWFTWAFMHDQPGALFFVYMFFVLAGLNSVIVVWVGYRIDRWRIARTSSASVGSASSGGA